MGTMKLTGRVISGRIELDDDVPLPDGTPVEVTISEVEPYELTAEEEEELWQADLSIERGEGISMEELLKKIRSYTRSD